MRWLEYLRDLNMLSIALRILISVFFGAVMGESAAEETTRRAFARTSLCASARPWL